MIPTLTPTLARERRADAVRAAALRCCRRAGHAGPALRAGLSAAAQRLRNDLRRVQLGPAEPACLTC